MFWRVKKEPMQEAEYIAALSAAGSLSVFADAGFVALEGVGRKELEDFAHSHKLPATADIQRFTALLGLPPEELRQLKSAFQERRPFASVISLLPGTYWLQVKPLKKAVGQAKWLLLLEAGMPPLPRLQKVKESHSDTTHVGWPQLVEMAPIPTLLLDAKGNVLRGNNSAKQLLPIQPEDRFLDYIAPQNREELTTFFLESLEGQTGQSMEVRLGGQEERTLALFISRVMLGAATAFLVQMIDLTEQKNLEIRFAHSQKMQAVGQLAGGIAHDFNNLLTAMIGFSDLLLMRHPAGDHSFADIMQIKQNANRAANLVRQLLAFSRKQTLKAEQVFITNALADLANLIRRLIGENITLEMQHGPDLWPVLVDQGQLEQVIINLCVNARDAMKGSGALSIRTGNQVVAAQEKPKAGELFPAEEDELTAGEYVTIAVEDSGCGIAPEMLRKIFEPFFSTKEVGEGTGLGLSTVYGIVKQTGGFISVRSQPGEGTCFTLYFRRYVPEENAAQGGAEEEGAPLAPVNLEPANAPLDLTGTGTILLVEDEAPVRIFSARALRNKGYTVFEADCAQAAFAVVAEHKGQLDLIITDVVMPGQTGPQMVEELFVQYPELKVIFISGYAEDAFIKTYGNERSFNFLPKPFSLKQLAAKVKEVLGE